MSFIFKNSKNLIFWNNELVKWKISRTEYYQNPWSQINYNCKNLSSEKCRLLSKLFTAWVPFLLISMSKNLSRINSWTGKVGMSKNLHLVLASHQKLELHNSMSLLKKFCSKRIPFQNPYCTAIMKSFDCTHRWVIGNVFWLHIESLLA